MQVLVEAGTILEVSPKPIKPGEAQVIDVGSRTLMPELVRCDLNR